MFSTTVSITEFMKNHLIHTNIHSTPQTSHPQGKTTLLVKSALNIYNKKLDFCMMKYKFTFCLKNRGFYHFTIIIL